MNLSDFTMNSMNLYQFEDVDYAQQKRQEAQEKIMEQVRDLIIHDTNRGKRKAQLKSNLSEATLCPKIFQGRNIGISDETKKKKLQIVQDFRFFPDPQRLKKLIEKEIDAKYSGYFTGMEYVDFTEEDQIEKDYLMKEGFLNWDRRDYQKLV